MAKKGMSISRGNKNLDKYQTYRCGGLDVVLSYLVRNDIRMVYLKNWKIIFSIQEIRTNIEMSKISIFLLFLQVVGRLPQDLL